MGRKIGLYCRTLIIMLSLVYLSSIQGFARVGILGRFADDVILENLELGRSYNLRELGNLPYKITNGGDEVVDVVIEVQIPPENALKPDYEAIPDPSWIKIIPDKFRLGPNENGTSEVIVTVPNDLVYNKRNFQVHLRAHTVGTGFMQAGVGHRIRFSTGVGPETLKAEKKRKAMFALDLDLLPINVYLSKVEQGKLYDAKKTMNISLKMVNKADNPIRIKMKSVQCPSNDLQAGYEPTPDPTWLTFKPAEFKIKGNTVKMIKLFVKVPKEELYYGKKYAFLVEAEIVGTDVPLELHSKVYVSIGEL